MSLLRYNLNMFFVLWRRVKFNDELILCHLNTQFVLVFAVNWIHSAFIFTIQPCHFYSMHSHMLTLPFVGYRCFCLCLCQRIITFVAYDWLSCHSNERSWVMMFFFSMKNFHSICLLLYDENKRRNKYLRFPKRVFLFFAQNHSAETIMEHRYCCVDNTHK